MTGVRSVADLRIGIGPPKLRFENISREAVCYWREDRQRQIFNTSSGALTDGGKKLKLPETTL